MKDRVNLYNKDCLEVFKELKDDSVNLIVTDPPYRITGRGNSGNSGGMCKKDSFNAGTIFEHNDIEVSEYAPEFFRVLKDGSHCYVMCNHVNLQSMLNTFTDIGFHFIKSLIWDICFHSFEQYSDVRHALGDLECKDKLIWEKTNPMPRNADRRYVCNAEMFTWYVKPGASWVFHCISDTYDGCVHKYPSESGGGFKRYHPCQKPQALLLDIIRRHSNVGDTVFDPFMGSGSIGVAAKTLDRHFIGIELDENYFEIAKQRIEGIAPIVSMDSDKGSKSIKLF